MQDFSDWGHILLGHIRYIYSCQPQIYPKYFLSYSKICLYISSNSLTQRTHDVVLTSLRRYDFASLPYYYPKCAHYSLRAAVCLVKYVRIVNILTVSYKHKLVTTICLISDVLKRKEEQSK